MKTKRKRSEELPSFSLRSEMKQNGSKKLPSFSLRREMKRNRSEKLPSFLLRSEMGANFFFASMRKNEMKRKQNEKEAETSKRKRIK
jgi:hypothetical protein